MGLTRYSKRAKSNQYCLVLFFRWLITPFRDNGHLNARQRQFNTNLSALRSVVERSIDHFTVVDLVTWPLNGSEAGVDLVLIQTSLLLLCKSSCSYAN